MFEPVLFLAVLILIVLSSFLLVRYYRRRLIMARIGYRLQLRFHPQAEQGLQWRYPDWYCLQVGHTHRFAHFLCAHRQTHRIFIFDYSLERGIGPDRREVQGTAVAVLGRFTLPGLVALRESEWEPIGRYGGFSRMQCGNRDLDRHFCFFSDQPPLARALLKGPICEPLRHCRQSNWEIRENRIVFFGEPPMSGAQIVRLVHRADELAGILNQSPVPDATLPNPDGPNSPQETDG
ncbi:MAG: hypothetical protein JW810_02060 [Sedimentisphaerales bacterium]|nr:hypothetical protein [Sedimentisphaerales bacterium]